MVGQLAPPRFDGTPEQWEALQRAGARPVPPGGRTEQIGSMEEERAARRQRGGAAAESVVLPPAGWTAVAIADGAQYGATEPPAGHVSHEQPGWRIVGRAKGLGDGEQPRC